MFLKRALCTSLLLRSCTGLRATSGLRMMSSASNVCKLGLCQIDVGADKAKNIVTARSSIIEASTNGSSDMVVLPECWNSPYSTKCFPEYAEPIPSIGSMSDNEAESPSTKMLCDTAREQNIYLVGGSIPERDLSSGTEKLYNTCIVVNPQGTIIAKHRKVHLFDIDVPGKITFKESDNLSGGDTISTFDSPWGMVGIGICYDIRFPEYAIALRQKGCKILIYPGAFNMITGPAHWELLQRARAVDAQCYVATVSPARDKAEDAIYTAWGHSMLVNPWGEIVVQTDENHSIIYAEAEIEAVESMRSSIPCWTQKRDDIYSLDIKS